LSTTEFHQFLKLPLLIQHFQEHRLENPGMSLAKFLRIHYQDFNIKDKDYDQDMKLPFKTADFSLAAQVILLETTSIQMAPPSIVEALAPSLGKDWPLLSSHPGKIFQPPRLA
jgi:hypothetical protein